MSSPRRLPKKKPASSAREDIAEDLPVLEPAGAAELPTLEPAADEDLPMLEAVEEPVDEGPVKTTCGPAGEPGFDLLITVDVPAMDKKAVPDAVQGPLQRAAERAGATLRHQRVLVRFTGDAMVGSAIKELVAGILKVHKPLKVAVRRGFGDEQVHEGALPKLAVEIHTDGATTKATFATEGLEALDLPVLVPPEIDKLAVGAKGRRFALLFRGPCKPDAALRGAIGKKLQDAGALSAAIGERVLFDRELADRVQVTAHGDGLVVRVTPADDPLVTQEALQMVLPGEAARFAGKAVRVQFASAPRAEDLALCTSIVEKAAPARLEVGDGKADTDVVLPKLLQLAPGAETVLRVHPAGRGRGALLVAFRREVGPLAPALQGKAVVVDWPAGTTIDAELEQACLREALGGAGAKAVACTVGGEQREPFVPPPLSLAEQGDLRLVRLDTDAGKPAELVRAVERRVPAMANALRGKAVRVTIGGSAAPSRTLLRAVCGAIEAAGSPRIEVEDKGKVDVLVPPMLTVQKGAAGVRIAAVTADRDPQQQAVALQRELDAAELPKGGLFTLSPSSATEALVAALVARGASRVLLDGNVPLQLHPPLFAAPERTGARLVLRAAPGPDATITGRQLERELPPLLADQKDLGKASVVVVWPGVGDPPAGTAVALVQALVAAGAAEVQLDGGDGKPFQVHPPVPVLELEPEPAAATAPAPQPVAAAPTPPAGSPAVAAGSAVIELLGRRDDAVPPLVLLGVPAGEDAAQVAMVQQQLEAHLPRLRGRAVLLVPRANGQDVPVRRPDALVAMLGAVVPTTAAATLVFRGPDAQGRPHFQVLHSTLRALPKGSVFGDPRARR